MKIVHCLLFLLASSFCCEGAARHSEPHVLPVSFHIGTGSKSALWGLKHWPWRAAPAPTTDGNPPANPSSSRAHHYISVTSSSEQGFRNAPRPPSLFSCTPSSRETRCFLPANFHFKDFPQNRPHGPALDWWQGGTQCCLLPNVCESEDTGRRSNILPPCSQNTGQVFLTRLQKLNEVRLNRHTPSALQSRPIKGLMHRFTGRNCFSDLFFP